VTTFRLKCLYDRARRYCFAALFPFYVLSHCCYAQTVDELIAKNLAARGGVEKLRAIRSMAMTGTIDFGAGSSPITVKVLRPNQIREDFEVQGNKVTRAYDGRAGWEAQGASVRSLADEELDNLREEAQNAIEGPLLDYAKKGSTAELVGKDSVEGRAVYKLKITTNLGTSVTQFLDAGNYLEIHEEIERSANGKIVTIVEEVGDYRDVEGVKFAHRFVSGTRENPGASKLQIEKMSVNGAVESSEFQTPLH